MSLSHIDSIPSQLRRLGLQAIAPDRFLVRDPYEIQPHELVVPRLALFVAQHFNGISTSQQIAHHLHNQGLDIPAEVIAEIARDLGHHHLLETPEILAQIRDREAQWLTKTRQAHFAGRAYPADPQALASWIDELITQAGGPLASYPELPGVAIPHIGPRAGGLTYAHAYRAIAAAPPVDVYVVIGIGHAGLQHGISLAPVNFATPLGDVPVDQAICDEWRERAGEWLCADQAVQQGEHSIEFQAVFLKHCVKTPFTIVPILTGFGGDRPPESVTQSLKHLEATLSESGRRVRIISSVDFSHIGQMYGDQQTGGDRMAEVEVQDRRAIAHLESADADAFWEWTEGRGNPTRICGTSSLWSTLQLLRPNGAELLDYAQTVMDDVDSRVTFASLRFF